MVKSAARILKPTDVTLEGRFTLNLDKGSPKSPPTPDRQVCEPSVNLIDNSPEFAVLEFTCSCGRKTKLKCTYEPQQNEKDTN